MCDYLVKVFNRLAGLVVNVFTLIVLTNIYLDLLKHEKASVDMFRCMKRRNGLDKEMTFYGLNLPEDITFIEELILKGQKNGEVKSV